MANVNFFIDKLKEKAIELNNTELLNKLNEKSFNDSLNIVCDTMINLGFEFKETGDKDFDYEKDIYFRVSRALSKNYFTIYYVNIKNGDYIGYSSNNHYNSLKIEESGDDFFSDLKRNARNVIYEEDIQKVITELQKENILKILDSGKSFELTYRLMLNNTPTYVMLKAIKINNEDDNVIFGITNIDKQKKRELEYQKAIKANITYSNIALALASNYLFIYYVDVNSSSYIEYNLDNDFQVLKEVSRGNDFFNGLEDQVKQNVVPEDQEKFLTIVNKENLYGVAKNGSILKVTYRQYFDDKPLFVELTILKMSSDSEHVILAVTSIDSWKKKEEKFNKKLSEQKALARTDALTGALNKYSYKELEKKINKHIKKGTIDDFAILVCDINNLKDVNDTKGHEAGDKYIKSAVNLIKKHFTQSKIYRIGGDEFVLLLTESDYYNKDFLSNSMDKDNKKNINLDRVTVSIGISDFNKKIDTSLADVFERADSNMYEYKKAFKEKFI